MNEHIPYELTIAQKLQQLPLPDMTDAIWARVERQLDIDLPTNEGGTPPSTPPGTGWIGGPMLGLFVGAFLFTFLFPKKEKTSTNKTFPASGTVTKALPVRQQPDPDQSSRVNAKAVRTPEAGNTNMIIDPPVLSIANPDSIIAITPSPQPDAPQASTVILPKPRIVMDSTLSKQGRGVTGITDNDYRIVPTQKDSL